MELYLKRELAVVIKISSKLHNHLKNINKKLCLVVLLITQFVSVKLIGQISLTSTTYSQDFNTLVNTGSSSVLPSGWVILETGTNANTSYTAGTGSSNSGDSYSFGSSASSDRALGGQLSGSLTPIFGSSLINNSGGVVSGLVINYTGEQWRLGATARNDRLDFQYSLDATSLNTGTWIDFNALDFVAPISTGTIGAMDGNATANKVAISSAITSLSMSNGSTIWIRWTDFNASGSDDGLGVDDFSISIISASPALIATPTSITGLSYISGNGPSAAQSYTLDGSNLTGDITITAPADFEVSKLSATNGFLNSVDVSPSSGLINQLIYVRLKAGLLQNTYSGNISHAGGGLTSTPSVGVSGIISDFPSISVNDVTQAEGNFGTSVFSFTVSLSSPAPAGGVSFDITSVNGIATDPSDFTAKTLTSQLIAEGSSTYTFDILVNGDTDVESTEGFNVTISNVTNANIVDASGVGTITNDDAVITKISAIQGSGVTTPLTGTTHTVDAVVTGTYQLPTGSGQIRGFFLQEETVDMDTDPNTSEGLFVFCNACTTAVSEGQKVRVTGAVSEFNTVTQISSTSIGILNAGNNLAQLTPATIDLPIVGDINTYYEKIESMLVSFSDNLTVSEYFELSRYGQLELFEGGRPRQFSEANTPSVGGYANHLDNLNRRKVIIDDNNNLENRSITLPDGQQFEFFPVANGGFSQGTQGVDFIRGGDVLSNLKGVLHWSWAGVTGSDAWRIRPLTAYPASFTVANPRPATAPAVGGTIKAASVNMLNYFTTIDNTSSTSSGPCGPGGTLDCRGADSNAELIRQRDRATTALCGLNAHVYALGEIENTNLNALNDIVSSLNATCGSSNPFAFVTTAGTSIGTDAIRVAILYRTNSLSPVGSALIDNDAVHSRPPLAQTFEVIDAANASFGQKFTVVANHFKSKGSGGATGPDLDANDGQGAYNATRTAQATRLISWVNSTVIPAAGDPDVLLLGDFNSYAKEDPITTITNAGYTDLETSLLGANAYSYVFDAQIGHLDYALSSSSLTPQITGIESWHINADESPLFDYNDDVKDIGESAFEEKPNGASLTPARTLYKAGTPYRASDHDPVLVGINLIGTPCVLARTISNTNYTDLQVIQAKNTIETLSGSPIIIAGTANVTFDAQKSITLNPGFETQPNAVFKTQLVGCN